MVSHLLFIFKNNQELMSLISISKVLSDKGYSTLIREEQKLLYCMVLDGKGHPIFERSSQVRLIDDKYHHVYFHGNLDIWNVFEKEEDVIDFIEKNYPVNKENNL